MNKPDNVADAPGIVEYGTNVSAPAITLPDTDSFKQGEGARARQKLKTQLEHLQTEYLKLMEQADYNDLIYKAEIRFIPAMGRPYHLYQMENNSTFLSLIAPEEWGPNFNFDYIGTFKQMTSGLWEEIQ